MKHAGRGCCDSYGWSGQGPENGVWACVRILECGPANPATSPPPPPPTTTHTRRLFLLADSTYWRTGARRGARPRRAVLRAFGCPRWRDNIARHRISQPVQPASRAPYEHGHGTICRTIGAAGVARGCERSPERSPESSLTSEHTCGSSEISLVCWDPMFGSGRDGE